MHLHATFVSLHLDLSWEAFEWVLGEVEPKFNQSLANPREMLGTLAAQCIRELVTQMTLNTFHYTCVSSKNMTLGVTCLKEIVIVVINIKTPLLSIYLVPELSHDPV